MFVIETVDEEDSFDLRFNSWTFWSSVNSESDISKRLNETPDIKMSGETEVPWRKL